MKKRGFTLIEMLIVIVIIGILAGALIPRIGNARDKATDVATQAAVNSITTSALQAIIDDQDPAPCGANDAINYDSMSDYGMTNMGTNYLCKRVAGDHVIVYTAESMNVATNNNCLLASITALDEDSDLATALGVVNGDLGAATGYNVYCLAQ